MTEDEARNKLCCKGSSERIQANGPCIGSACMAWRWKYVDTTIEPHMMMATSPPPKRTYERTEHGYCGLAGSA